MRRRLIDKIYTASLMCGLLITNAAVAGSYTEKLMLKHSAQLVAGQWNPWVLPEVPEKKKDFQCPADWQSAQFQDGTAGTKGQAQAPEFKKRLSGRFVTPDILESLKQQQIQTQMTPSYESYRQRPQQRRSQQPVTRLPENRNYYGEPSYGMGSANPLYDVPTVSPWGSGADVIYQGGSFPGALPDSSPWVPNEAIGGLPPIHVPPFEGSSSWGEFNNSGSNNTGSNNAEAEYTERQKDNNVFNPFTFVPNRGW